MDEENKKEGVSVKEIEGYAKNKKFEIFFCLLFVLATLFTFIFWGTTWSILAVGVGGVISSIFPHQIHNFASKMSGKLLHQEGMTQLIIGIAILIIAIFVAPLIFLLFGLHAGKSMILTARESGHHD